MNRAIGRISLVTVMLCWSTFALSEEAITEDDVVNVLSGEQQRVAPRRLPGIAFSVALKPFSQQGFGAKSERPGDKEHTDQDLYNRLVPVGRAVESEALQGFRFAIMVHSDLPRSEDHDDAGSLQVAQTIKRILTVHFGIQADRLLISNLSNRQRADGQFAISGQPLESRSIPTWKVEIHRLE